MKKSYLNLFLFVALIFWGGFLGGNSQAFSAEFSGHFGAKTDYIWRGMSFTNHEPVVQGGLDFTTDYGLNFGAAALAGPPEGYGKGLETDLYASYSYFFGEHWSAYVGTLYFYYPHDEAARYGRTYVGLGWKHDDMSLKFEVSQWDYEASGPLSSQDSLEYALYLSIWGFQAKILQEEDYFVVGDNAYGYYEVKRSFYFPEAWDFPEDLCLGVALGYASYGNEEGMGSTSYTHSLLSLDRKIDGFNTSLWVNLTNRKNPMTEKGLGDNTVGFSFIKNF